MATLVDPKAAPSRKIRGKDYKLAGHITFDEYWNSPTFKAFHTDAVCRREGPVAGLQTRYSVWEPA